MFETFAFYWLQILAGAALGAALSVLGVFVVLRRLAVFGITLSQATTTAVSLTLLLNLKGPQSSDASRFVGDGLVLLLSAVFMAPFYIAIIRAQSDRGALLVLGMVVFAALSQSLLALGGQVQSHLVQAFFGNVLTTNASDLAHLWLPFGVLGLLFAFFYRDLLAVAFDRDHAHLSGAPVRMVEVFFFLALSYAVAEGINLMGSFYTLAQLIVPALVALSVTRNVPAALLVAAVYAAVMTVAGFVLSLVPLPLPEGPVNLPTSSTIVLLLAAGYPVVRLIRRALASVS